MVKWQKYEIGDGEDFIPVEKWGKDHWSTLAYLETVCVEQKGVINNNRMRCNPRLHRELANITFYGSLVDGSKYPTILKNNEQFENHDDWSCAEDMVKAGYIEMWTKVSKPEEVFGGTTGKVELTESGKKVSSQLRDHKMNDGKWSNFELRIGVL